MKHPAKTSLFLLMLILTFSCQKYDTNDLNSESSNRRIKLKYETVPLVQKYGLKSMNQKANKYVFYLVAELDAPVINKLTLQATHVDIADNLAFVSYNMKGPIQKGAIDIIDITNPKLPSLVKSLEFPEWDINTVVYYNHNILLAGQYKYGAFFAAVNLNGDEVYFSKISSFSANNMKIVDNKLFITSADINGGLTILNGDDFSKVAFIHAEDARSVASLDSDDAYMLSAAGISLYSKGSLSNLMGMNPDYLQQASKAELDISEHYIFAALNKGGSMIWDRITLAPVTQFTIPDFLVAKDPENYVSNSVSYNNPLLFVANGGSGIMVAGKDSDSPEDETFMEYGYFDFNEKGGSTSSNFVKSKGRFIFVASGLGGLKILTFEEASSDCTWIGETAYSGNIKGAGSSWWYIFESIQGSSQPIYAGRDKIEGAYAIYDNGSLEINLGSDMRLKDTMEPVKVQGYTVVPDKRPASGLFKTYKGEELSFHVDQFPYYVIHLDVEVCYPHLSHK
jgi:hypothetical protein